MQTLYCMFTGSIEAVILNDLPSSVKTPVKASYTLEMFIYNMTEQIKEITYLEKYSLKQMAVKNDQLNRLIHAAFALTGDLVGED